MSDKIKIKNLEVFANHGVLSEENKLGQKFLVDAVLYVDTRNAGQKDDLKESVDYAAVSRLIVKEMQQHTYKLLEAAAEHLAAKILTGFSNISQVDLEIKKPWAPIGLPLDTVSVEISRRWHKVYLSIGSNIGDRAGYISYGVGRIASEISVRKLTPSKLIETAPYGFVQQPPFLNGAIELETLLSPYELLAVIHRIEAEAGRERTIHWGPRTLDIDILLYDDCIFEKEELMIPHPDMANRMFVLEPLAKLCPGKVHPVTGKTIWQMKRELEEHT